MGWQVPIRRNTLVLLTLNIRKKKHRHPKIGGFVKISFYLANKKGSFLNVFNDPIITLFVLND